MIESTNRALENILRNQLKLPGQVKDISATQEEQEADHKDIQRLADRGKLLTFREFVIALYRAMDLYNGEKAHRGVLREWRWDPKPKQVTPMQCLKMCYAQDGWRPKRLPDDAIEMAFLPKGRRSVDRGRISFRKERYEADALMRLNGRRVEVLFDPLDTSWVIVLQRGEFLCRAELVEYSSMKNWELAERKIKEKAERKRLFLREYMDLTSWVPDFREYSQAPAAERAAAIMGKAKREATRKAQEDAERYRVRTVEEMAAEVKQIEHYRPPRTRPVFVSERDRYQYVLDVIAAGEELGEDDRGWMAEYEGKMSEDTVRYWAIYKDAIGLTRGTKGGEAAQGIAAAPRGGD
jgi:hypothetical protein